MTKVKTEKFIETIDKGDFEKNRDYLMKLVENDPRLIAWYAWGTGLLFPDFSYLEMFNYIGTISEDKLKENIELLDVRIADINNYGVILDNNFRILDNDQTIGLLNLENETNPYSFKEKIARSMYYICSLIFSEKGTISEVDKDHYRNLKPPISLWIFPETSENLGNTISILTSTFPQNKLNIEYNSEKVYSYSDKPEFQLKGEAIFIYLGNPYEINLDLLIGNERQDKLGYILLLSDLIFDFTVKKEERLELAKNIFNLKEATLEKEINAVEAITSAEEYFKLVEKDLLTKRLAKYLIKESNEKLSYEQALEKAKKILSED